MIVQSLKWILQSKRRKSHSFPEIIVRVPLRKYYFQHFLPQPASIHLEVAFQGWPCAVKIFVKDLAPKYDKVWRYKIQIQQRLFSAKKILFGQHCQLPVDLQNQLRICIVPSRGSGTWFSDPVCKKLVSDRVNTSIMHLEWLCHTSAARQKKKRAVKL